MKHEMNRRQFLAWTAAGAAALAARPATAEAAAPFVGTGAAASATYAETSARLAVGDAARIKLMQVTDLHFFCHPDQPELDKRTIEELPRLRDLTQPDLIMVTGDFWHDNPGGKGQEYAEFAIDKISSLGVPWIFTWGNHDALNDYAKGHDTFHDAKHSLYRGGPGAGNYTVRLEDKGGVALWDLLCINSSSRGVGDAQRQWLQGVINARKTEKPLPAFAVYHIPLKQQIDAWGAKKASGVRLAGGGSAEMEKGETLPLLKALNTRAGFCGHIHTNDYVADADGVQLTFGHATGWAGWGADVMPKGCKLITLNAQSGNHTAESILADGSRWQPTAGQQIDQVLDTPWDAPAKHKAA